MFHFEDRSPPVSHSVALSSQVLVHFTRSLYSIVGLHQLMAVLQSPFAILSSLQPVNTI